MRFEIGRQVRLIPGLLSDGDSVLLVQFSSNWYYPPIVKLG
jgi:hypothetical protein